jgi:ferric-dicitrate binding protein FerR (iron transport regulator)
MSNGRTVLECVTLEELIEEVNRYNLRQLRLTRPINDKDMRLAGSVDPTNIEVLVRLLEAVGAATIVSVNNDPHVIFLQPIPNNLKQSN